jgi:hypothetical protein
LSTEHPQHQPEETIDPNLEGHEHRIARHREEREAREIAITPNMIVKWGGFMFAAVGALVTVVIYGSSLKSDVGYNALRISEQEKELRQVLVDADKASSNRDAVQQVQINELKRRADDGDRNVSELARKVDVLSTKMDYAIELLKGNKRTE